VVRVGVGVERGVLALIVTVPFGGEDRKELTQRGGEGRVEQAIGLVENEEAETRHETSMVVLQEKINEAPRCGNNNMRSL
jgi:hypothetical protein